MSACRQRGGIGLLCFDGRPGERLDRRVVRSESLEVERQRRRRDHVGDPVPVAFRGTDLEVGPQRPGDLLGDELPERPAADPPDDLPDQVTVVGRVIPEAVPGSHHGAWAAIRAAAFCPS
jgi:hypothetical protein